MRYDWLIVGAGFTGCVMAERIASQLGQRVLVIDKRDHIGGNAYDHYDEHGVLVHKYGPHIFHTNDARVWEYLSQFTKWHPYEHSVLAVVDGRHVPVPFNLDSLYAVFPSTQAEKLERLLVATYGAEVNVPILRMIEHEDEDLRWLSRYIYKNIFENYTLKQWGMRPEELGPTVTGRVPVRISRDGRYFQDRYQAMPAEGFTPMFRRMLSNPVIHLELNTDLADLGKGIEFGRMLYTGPIDAHFGYMHGQLPYRSLRFEFDFFDCEQMQPVTTVNYPNEHDYTRITEFKHMTGQRIFGTSTVREYPQAHVPGKNEPYYPVPLPASAELFARYAGETAHMKDSVLFCGRLADYKYYNMDQVVARALMLFEKRIAKPKREQLVRTKSGGHHG
jgi:UDP-galactopyranose mutase